MFTRAQGRFLPWARSIQFTPLHPISLRAVLILFSHLCLGLPVMIFLSGFPTKPCVSPLSHAHHVPRPSHSLFDDSAYVYFLVEECKLSVSSIMQISQTSCTSHIWSNRLPQPPVLGHTRSLFWQCDKPSFTPIQNKIVTVNIFNLQIGRQTIPD